MGGIIFFKTLKLKEIREFYLERTGSRIWMDQDDCVIMQYDNLLFGFCQRDKADLQGMITFYYSSKEEVDDKYMKFKTIADNEPRDNPRYPIYHFFATDPEGRILEFQYFYNL